MPPRKKIPALVACGKRLEGGMRWLRRAFGDACATMNILRDAHHAGGKSLPVLAAGLDAPDVIIVGGTGHPSHAAECLRCVDTVARGPLPPRRVWVVAPAEAMEMVRREAAAAMLRMAGRGVTAPGRTPDIRFVEHAAGAGTTALTGLHEAVAASTSSHVAVCDARASICTDAILWIAAVLERNRRECPSREILAVYGDDAAAAPATGPWSAATIHHKPDFSWTTLLSGSYLGPIVAFDRAAASRALGRLVARGVVTSSCGESLYALALETLRGCRLDDVVHVRHPLAVRRRGHDDFEADDTARIAAESLGSVGIMAAVSAHPRDRSLHRIGLRPRRSPHVSIVIPTRNAGALVRSCVNGLRERPGYEHYDVTVIDHESDEPDVLEFLASESSADRLRVFPYRGAFNFAAMNNAAVRSTRGGLLLFLNNDVDGFSPGWLEQMVATFELDDRIGAVGVLLQYPEGRIQHAGVVLNAKRLCQHAHRDWPADALGYHGRIQRLQEFSAVTAACMMVRRDAFEALGGFDEQFLDNYNDIDLCLRLRAAGFAVVYRPEVRATHWEGHTRTAKETGREAFAARWRHAFHRDPFYHPHLAATEFRPDGLARLWRQRKEVALVDLLEGRDA